MLYAMTKKAILIGVLGGGTMMALFGTPAGSYFGTAVFKVRSAAKNAVPVQFEIDRARREVEKLTPAIHQHIEILARAEEDVKRLDAEILDTTAKLDRQKSDMLALRSQIQNGHVKRTSYSTETKQLEESLRNRLESYNRCERVLNEKQATLVSRQKVVESAKEHLVAIATQKKALEAKIEEIQARLAAIDASNARNQYHFDGTALASAKKTVAELDQRLNVVSRVAEMEGRLAEDGTLGPESAPLGDVTKEIDAKFGLNQPAVEDQKESTKL